MSKKIFYALIVSSLFVFGSSISHAQAGVVSHTADSALTLTGITDLTVKSGSSADSVVVDTTTFTVTVTNPDQFIVESSNRDTFAVSPSTGTTIDCQSSLSRLTIAPTSGSVTIVVTPSATACVAAVATTTTTSSGAGGGWGGAITGTTVTPVPTSAIVVNSAQGGKVTLRNNDGSSATLAVPALAVSQDTSFSIANVTPPSSVPDTGLTMIGPVYQITALSNGQTVTSFAMPLALAFHYFSNQVQESSLHIYSFNATTQKWEALANSIVDTQAHIVSASADHLTLFTIFGSNVAQTAPPASTVSAQSSPVILLRMQGSAKIYAIINGKKHWIKTPQEFNAAGYNWHGIQTVNAAKIASYPNEGTAPVKAAVKKSKAKRGIMLPGKTNSQKK